MTREEAINEIKSWAIPSKKGREVLETLIPELRESEDERIRKALIDEIKVRDEDYKLFKHVSKEKVLAYLEKKKEQKPAEWSDEDEKTRRNLMSLLVNMRGDRITEGTYQKYYPWLKDLHPSWKPSEEQMQYLLAVINDPNNAGAESCHLILESLYNDLKEL